VQAEKDDARKAEATAAMHDDVREGGPGERLEDYDRARSLKGLVRTNDVQVREPLENPSFPEQPAPRPSVLDAIRAQDLGDAAAGSLLAPDVVNVEDSASVEGGNHPITGREKLAFAQQRGDLAPDLLVPGPGRDLAHGPPAFAPAAPAVPAPEWCRR
jgi:hypothetical protein